MKSDREAAITALIVYFVFVGVIYWIERRRA
jgi:hypothetical protein